MKVILASIFLFLILLSNANAQIDTTYTEIIEEQVDISKYEEAVLGLTLEIGGYAGGFNGELAKVYGFNGGAVFGIGTRFKNYNINIDFGLGGAKKNGSFNFPPEVIRESTNAHWFYGMSLSKIIEVNESQSLQTKIGVGGYGINAGFISEGNLYKFNGFDLYAELAYSFKVADTIAYGPHKIMKTKNYVTPFIQMHSWHGDKQSEGKLISGGIRFSFEFHNMVKKH